MRLSAETHKQVEDFLRQHFNDPELRLPPVKIVGGRFARRLTKALNIGAITVGRRVFVSPAWLKRDAEGRWAMPGWLLVHEGAHVLQYRRSGLFGFLFGYLREYARFMRKRRWDARAHKEAYRSLSAEVEARAAEEAYKEFLRKGEDVAFAAAPAGASGAGETRAGHALSETTGAHDAGARPAV